MPEWLAHRAATMGTRLAVAAGEIHWSFAELDRRAAAAAAQLDRAGVRPGDRVALLLPNGPEFVESFFGIARHRAVAVPLNLRLAPAELAWQLADAAPAAVIHGPTTADVAATAVRMAGRRESLLFPAGAGEAGADKAGATGAATTEPVRLAPRPLPGDPDDRIDLEAPLTIMYTSGTTGRPKGAVLTWGNYWWSAIGSALNLGLAREDRWLACLPLFHVGGLSILTRSVIYGTAALVHARFDPEAVNRAIDREGVTLVSVVGTMLQRMLDARGDRPYPPSLRAVLVGGGPVSRALLERALGLGLPVVQTYGLTETASQATTLPPQAGLDHLGSAGKPLLPTQLRIAHDTRRSAGPEEPGEILIRGPTVSPGYWDGPQGSVSDAPRPDGWLRTGDVGYLDREGYLYVLDRRDDLIVSGGENIYPAEVEAALLAHPAVQEAGVVGLPDPVWGQVPIAVVRLHAGQAVSDEQLAAFCRSRLARYKVPVRFHRVTTALPRNAAGKLSRRVLRDQLREAGPPARAY